MLKLLLSHWQTHREPLNFVLTDDPLYCSHLTKSPFPEVYSVNRVNPIFEDDENETKNETPTLRLKRSLSEERRENETRASDDTGYSSSGQFKSLTTADSLTDDVGSLEARHMSSDSDEYSHPEAVVVSADVHRVSYPEDVIVLSSSASSNSSHIFSANSYSSHYGGSSDSSQEPFDSLTMSSLTDTSLREDRQKSGSTDAKRPNSLIKEKLQRLLERGNERSSETFLDSLDPKPSSAVADNEIEKTKMDLMKSLTRALNNKVPKREQVSPSNSEEAVTRTDSALSDHHSQAKSVDRKSTSSTTSPKTPNSSKKSPSRKDSNGVTRQDESSGSSSISFTKSRKYQLRSSKYQSTEKESKRERESPRESSGSQQTHSSHKCKLCENAHRPLAFHQLLPGHWSYDNVYLPQISGMCCPCMHHHHHNPLYQPSSDDDVFYPLYYHHDLARARHSWAPYSTPKNFLDNNSKPHNRSSEDKGVSTSSKENLRNSSGPRYSPDGSSRETDSSHISNRLKQSLSERRSLREPKKCKCEHCLASVLDKDTSNPSNFPNHPCTCYCLSHRRVKFASDTDVSQHRHIHSAPMRVLKDGNKLANGDTINAAFVMNLPHLNGHALTNQGAKDNGLKSKKAPPLIPRGLKEPIKMDELYRTYPINFRDWEAHYRRTFLQKRRKRALNMVGMAIGIILVVGIAIALTFVFLRIKRPA
ncbi:uncharacterized protein LOC118181311 [Stegodyphus dumicola]|uniref:uncharacterized protein LOC118181311 n=1 Tax=Stegodyphus dumicola TaxID=202533 RepID=UPI0015AA10BE|nr:uncharacterized protein LOC118181311 [Stegodyphus dumicola]XP_035206315.1 uncharacterized protein LOC118181311 [Stegodyphus dumicola]XP_035206316.1 uncharacterized protein LOC118181311 [Stegodyphus dumicola]XP_035206317.1 uncharacterized protein LOC118181311 [Stegodyphus dumicola]